MESKRIFKASGKYLCWGLAFQPGNLIRLSIAPNSSLRLLILIWPPESDRVCNLIFCLRFDFFRVWFLYCGPKVGKENTKALVLVTSSYLFIFLALLYTLSPQISSKPVSFCLNCTRKQINDLLQKLQTRKQEVGKKSKYSFSSSS